MTVLLSYLYIDFKCLYEDFSENVQPINQEHDYDQITYRC